MLQTRKLETSIKECLFSLSTDTNIIIASLPNNPNQSYQNIGNKNVVKIIVPIVTGEKPNPTQKLRYEILIHILVQHRNSENIPSIDNIKNDVIRLILNNLKNYLCYTSFWFSSYRLIPAQNGYWSAEISFVMETN